MEFSFEVDPDSDIAIGTELVAEEVLTFEDGVEFDLTGYDPLTPTGAKPGSDDKVKMLAARYSAGVPLWHDSDCYDHGPVNTGILGLGDSDDLDDLDELEIEVE
ncbi:hypothetical protein [Thalassoglobus polymorphus]|uniref:Uncharacterized protein n=1 Tax=Thalassoglobus polymorphus TaxID=2527994 RepID=A0A517QPJ8_9PLAN|nr:hypothetical protein [Thalassoglobus polymorphus]QDT33542.1 hypothetical protein Mal48_27950 [Thalassoglobus polymorphus]